MVGYRRNKTLSSDSEIFLTIVTFDRNQRFIRNDDLKIVRDAIAQVRELHDFDILAWVILADHLHLLLSPGDSDYSIIVSSLKRRVSWKYRDIGLHQRRAKFWQDRFWEHTIRAEDDHRRCVEYIHYNPVKHGLADSPFEWEYSSFNRYVERRIYEILWGSGYDVEIPGAEYD